MKAIYWRSCLMALITLATIGGCSLIKGDNKKTEILDFADDRSKSSSSKNVSSTSAEEQVRFDGGLLLGDTDNLAYTPDALGAILVDLIDNEKRKSLNSLIGHYPDVVMKILIDADGERIDWPHLRTIAQSYDSGWNANKGDSWQRLIDSLSKEDSKLTVKRAEFLQLLGKNQPSKALKLGLVSSTAHGTTPLIQAEANRLEGIAYLMLEDDKRSIERFETAMTHVRDVSPFFASKIGLLLGEAQRHDKQLDEWKRSWQIAIDLQSSWMDQDTLYDPAFWKKAAFLRPVSEKWPVKVIERMKMSLAKQGLTFSSLNSGDDEAVVWAIIGVQSLTRRESQNAILAFKKSEALATSQLLKNELQMHQAVAMIAGGQHGPASAILLRLSSSEGLLADRAKAILATMKLQNGSIAQGMNLLQSAIKTSDRWPTNERLRAHADYGLALLMRGREKQGVQLLNQVFDEFAANKSYEHATQCLWNLAKYFQTKEDDTEYQAYVARLQQFEKRL